MVEFSLNNYPKSYGCIDKNKYRFEKYLELSNRSLRFVENRFWKFVAKTSSENTPTVICNNLKYVGSGWEWSVFLDKNKIVKIPAGIFPEVNDIRYLNNTKTAHELILKYIPSKFVANTFFERKNDINIINQEYVEGKDNFVIGYHTKNTVLLNNINELMNYLLTLLKEQSWLPDFDIRRKKGGFVLRNIIINKDFCPKIIDFTAYYDVFRLHPYRQKVEILAKKKKIIDLLSWIDTKNK